MTAEIKIVQPQKQNNYWDSNDKNRNTPEGKVKITTKVFVFKTGFKILG